jgi:hypothetical protein
LGSVSAILDDRRLGLTPYNTPERHDRRGVVMRSAEYFVR